MTDEEAERLYKQYGFLIYRRCRNILRDQDEAWDATQEVFLKLVNYYPANSENGTMLPWIYRVTANHCFNLLREKRKFNESVVIEDIPLKTDIEEQLHMQILIKNLFSVKDVKVRNAAYFTYVEGLKQDEIQKVTGQSPATIRRNLAKFMAFAENLRKKAGF